MGDWTITIPRALTSANARIVNSGKTRWAYAKARKEWVRDIANAMIAGRVPPATGPRHVILTRLLGKGQVTFDDDNLSGGAKLVRDAMQRPRKRGRHVVAGASLIIDDSARFSTFDYAQERAPDGRPGTRIEISELPQGEE